MLSSRVQWTWTWTRKRHVNGRLRSFGFWNLDRNQWWRVAGSRILGIFRFPHDRLAERSGQGSYETSTHCKEAQKFAVGTYKGEIDDSSTASWMSDPFDLFLSIPGRPRRRVGMAVCISRGLSDWFCSWCDWYWGDMDDWPQIRHLPASFLAQPRAMLLVFERDDFWQRQLLTGKSNRWQSALAPSSLT